MIETNTLLSLIAIIILICATIFIYIILKREEKYIHSKDQDKSTYDSVLSDAKDHAKSLLSDTGKAAANLLNDSRKTNEQIEIQTDKILQSIAEKQIHNMKSATSGFEKDYESELQKTKQEMYQTMQKMIQDIQNNYQKSLEEFTSELSSGSAKTQEIIEKKRKELMNQVEKDVEEYRKSQLDKIDSQTSALVKKVYLEVLKKSIPDTLHHELIVKSLEDAKKDEILKL